MIIPLVLLLVDCEKTEIERARSILSLMISAAVSTGEGGTANNNYINNNYCNNITTTRHNYNRWSIII